jgi:hypothetical protein
MTLCRVALAVTLACLTVTTDAGLERVRVSEDGKGFVTESGEPFVLWGFNYDHDEQGRLIEDYWADEWPKVEADFREMKALGANVVRVHLQTGRFLNSPDEPNRDSLGRLKKLVVLAEETGLYLDLTGLGCYHKPDVPAWYDALDEPDRWAAQATFWEAVADTCKSSPAVFCYDLMNEPVVPGGKDLDWLGPPLGDKHFVQRISRNRDGRERPDIARTWIERLSAAIRKHDRRTLITVGLVHWSLDRPGLSSGFVPGKVADRLDFLCVHLYPESGKLDEALETLKGFAGAGKPVVVEETFVLKCSAEELGEFMDRAGGDAAGWVGFYWGTPPDELRGQKTFAAAIMLKWLDLFQQRNPAIRSPD